MTGYATLARETRGDLEDILHLGYACVVDENGRVVCAAGDPEAVVYLRSSSKPIQALPTIERRLDEKYGLTDEETALFSGSHMGQDVHIRALESIFRKAGLSEDMLCVLPTVPECPLANEARVRAGLPKRRAYHNCSGKHAALMLLQRDLGGDVLDYWKEDSVCQREVLRVISVYTETNAANIPIGTDGCGVPVFAVPMRNIAVSFKNLACSDRVQDDSLAETAVRYLPRLSRYPHMIKGYGEGANVLCSLLNRDPNLIVKGGAHGLYAMGLRRERLGVAFRTIDGDASSRPLIALAILRKLGYENKDTLAMLQNLGADKIINDTGALVGRARADICWNGANA